MVFHPDELVLHEMAPAKSSKSVSRVPLNIVIPTIPAQKKTRTGQGRMPKPIAFSRRAREIA